MKVISLVLINSFLLLDIAWAGDFKNAAQNHSDCLSPSLQINTKIFSEYFSDDNSKSFIDQLIAAGLIKSPEHAVNKQAILSMEKIWNVLLNMPGSRIKELKGVVTFKNHQTGQTQDKFEHTQMLADFEQGLDENRGDRQKAREIIYSRKDPGLDELDSLLLDSFLDYYNQISQNELKLLRFAIALHDLGNIYGKGEDHFASKDLSEQVLDQFIDKGIIDEQEYKVIIALVYLHNTFNTIHFGEMLPGGVSKYLDSENVNKELYFKLAPILYIADVGSVAEGRLSDRHLSNVLFMSQEENVMSLIHNWQSVRLNLGFCGQSNIIIDFTKMHNAMPEHIQHSLDLIIQNNKQQFDYFWNNFLLKNSSFGGHAVYIFRHLNDISQAVNDNENALIKFLYIISLVHKQNPNFEYMLFAPATNDQKFANKLHQILSGLNFEQIESMFVNHVSFETIEKQLGITVSLNGQVLEINTEQTKITKQQDLSIKLSGNRSEIQKIISFLAAQDPLPAKANALVVFGNEDLQTPIQVAKIYTEKQPNVVVFAGGIGHSTQNLIDLGSEYLSLNPADLKSLSEAEIFSMIFKQELEKQGASAEDINKINILLDKASRNSQENAKNSLKLLFDNGFLSETANIILMQKPLLQTRAASNLKREISTFEKKVDEKFSINYFNYAPYVPAVSMFNDKELLEITNDALGEVERLKIYPTQRFNYIDSVDIPESVDKAYYNLSKLLYSDQFIESEGVLVAGLIKAKENARTDINRPLQVESGQYRAGSSFTGFATERYQGSLYLVSGSAKAQIKEGNDIVQTIELTKGDIINLFVNSDIVFTQDSKFDIFRQTDVSKTMVDHNEKLDGEENIGSRAVVKKHGSIVADVYRDSDDKLIATVHKASMDSPKQGMVMITPKSATIGIGVKIANGNETAHRHELNGKSKMEIALCRSGSLTAYIGNKQGQDVNKVEVNRDDMLILYPDSVHSFEFRDAKMAIIIQDPGRGMDKVMADLDKIEAMKNIKPVINSVITITAKAVDPIKENAVMNQGLTLIGQSI